MILRELFVKLGLDVDQASFAKGQLAANLVAKAVTSAFDMAVRAVGGLEDALIGFNARAEQSKMGLAGIAGMNLKLPWEEAKAAADELFKGLQEDAAKTPAETSELVDFAQQIAGAYLAAGKNMKDLRQFTTQAVVAAKMLRAEGTAATDIKQAIQGRVGVKDMFAANVINSLGMSIEQFNKKSMQERADLFAKGLNNPTIRAAMLEYETQWDGVTSTIKDNISIMLGEVGKPLFEFFKKNLVDLGKWIMKNRETWEKWGKAISRDLVVITSSVMSLIKFVGGGLSSAFEYLGRTGKIAFGVLAAVIAAAMSPLTAMVAALSFVMLVFDDIRGYREGEDSLFGTFKDELASWLKPNENDPWWLSALKEMVELMARALGLAKELGLAGDGPDPRRGKLAAAQAGAGKVGDYLAQQSINSKELDYALQNPGLRSSQERVAAPQSSWEAARIGWNRVFGQPEARTSAMGPGGALSVTAPVTLNVTQQPGENGEGFAKRVGDLISSHWDMQLEAASAGVKR